MDNENINRKVEGFKCAVLTISDRCSLGEMEDQSGKILKEILRGIDVEILRYDIVADEEKLIKEKLIYYSDSVHVDLILTSGGTGLGPRDVTPEATCSVCEKMIPGIPELIRFDGLKKTRNAALSRAACGIRGSSLIINLPGSPKGAQESFMIILELIPHALDMLRGQGHPHLEGN